MRTFIRRNRYLITACALLFVAAAGLGLFAAQANAAGVDAAAKDALEQPADGAAQEVSDKGATPTKQEAPEAKGADKAAGQGKDDARETDDPTLVEAVNAVVSTDAEDEAAPTEVGIEERIDGEATKSSDYIEVNASSDEEPVELEECPVSAL